GRQSEATAQVDRQSLSLAEKVTQEPPVGHALLVQETEQYPPGYPLAGSAQKAPAPTEAVQSPSAPQVPPSVPPEGPPATHSPVEVSHFWAAAQLELSVHFGVQDLRPLESARQAKLVRQPLSSAQALRQALAPPAELQFEPD